MNSADFHPEFSAEEIAFLSARRHLTILLCRMVAFLQLKGFQDCGADCETFGPDGFQVREDNQYQLDGQQVQVRVKFSHLGAKYLFDVLLTNDAEWKMVIKVRSGVEPEMIIFSDIYADDLETAHLQVHTAFLRTVEDVLGGRVVKGHTQVIGISGRLGIVGRPATARQSQNH